ncbi:MAG: mechanosensitive ion channel [Gammaproteobacteria bacterium]|nr:mechanosensitive ion channel [Gammaproteobacteria bacterium]MBT4494104.1 mechanosensitive ion channel [Gammaproteobacteria bacterium]MBT7369589.1 mechanosensitive ion channel [Gammaproteobacteria bacterium]
MEPDAINQLAHFVPSIIAFTSVLAVILIANALIRRGQAGEISVPRQMLMLCLTAAGLLIVIFSLPLSETSRGQVLSLLGIVITAVIALSSTTFVANVMAGLMLRAVNSFRPGDFIRSEIFFGRVTERGVFHTEIQTEDRDLMTLPNMYLVNNPVTVVHNSGTIISANLSLGYDIPYARVEELLKKAAEESGLAEAFVLVVDLNDYSVSYRVGGFSSEISHMLTIKSGLRKKILNTLHESGIEIVSPNFMNQRALEPGEKIIPARYGPARVLEDEAKPEDMIFDKADSAAEKEALKRELTDANERLKALSEEIKSLEKGDRSALENERNQLSARIEEITQIISHPPPE